MNAVLIACCLVAGCHGADAGVPSADGGDARDAGASLELLRDAFCKMARACCSAAGLPIEPLAACEPELERQVDAFGLARRGTVTIDNAKIATCVAQLSEQAQTCAPPLSLCIEAFHPRLP